MIVLMCLLLGACGSCSNRIPDNETRLRADAHVSPSLLNGHNAIARVRGFLGTGSRDAGTPGAQKAAEYLAAELRSLGVKTEIDEFEDDTPGGHRTFRNVIGRIGEPGGGVIVLGSHYDTKSGIGDGFQGANDSGSSTGLLLELAAVLKTAPIAGTELVLAFLDGEECTLSYGRNDGLHGSRRLARALLKSGVSKRVAGVVILDMVGDKDLNVSIPNNSTPGLCSAVFSAAHMEGTRSKFSQSQYDVLDDHVPFLDAGMPALDIIDFTYGSADGLNDYWHTKEDTIDKLSAESLETIGRVTIRLINMLVENKTGVTR
ncbi:MAG: M28 family peptidase [bacterium]